MSCMHAAFLSSIMYGLGTFTSFTQQSGFSVNDLYRSLDGDAAIELNFPEPEKLTNVKSTKSILNLIHCDFTYPGSNKVRY